MKILLGLLTVIITSTGFMVKSGDDFFGKCKLFTAASLGFLYVSLLLAFIFWAAGCWKANNSDKYWSAFYRIKAEVLLGLRKDVNPYYLKASKWKVFEDWSWRTQIFTVAMLMFFSWLFIFIR